MEQTNIAEYEKAIDRYHELARQNPNDVTLLTNLAWSYERAGEHKQAVQQFKQALEVDQDSIDAQYGLGVALFGADQMADARRAFEHTLELVAQSDDRSYMVVVQEQVNVYMRRF